MNATPKINGDIGYFGLAEWWLETFNDDEKNYIINRFRKYNPRSGPDSLLEGHVFISTIPSTRPSTVSSYLNFLTSIFQKPGENTIARKFAKKSLELATYLPDLDNTLLWTIRLNYKARNIIPGALEIAIDACHRQIKIAPEIANQHKAEYPSLSLGKHEGYTQLAKILEKRRDFVEVIRLARKAKMEGWKGDWDARIERCEKRIKNASPKFGLKKTCQPKHALVRWDFVHFRAFSGFSFNSPKSRVNAGPSVPRRGITLIVRHEPDDKKYTSIGSQHRTARFDVVILGWEPKS